MAIPERQPEDHHWHYPEPETTVVDHVDQVDRVTMVRREDRGLMIALALVGLLLLTGMIGWLMSSEDDDAAVEDSGVTIADIVADPEAFVGRQVTIRGEIGDFVAPTMFVTGTADADEDILVWADPEIAPDDATEGRIVDVAGEVRIVDQDFIDEFGPFDEAADITIGTVIVVSTSVDVVAVT